MGREEGEGLRRDGWIRFGKIAKRWVYVAYKMHPGPPMIENAGDYSYRWAGNTCSDIVTASSQVESMAWTEKCYKTVWWKNKYQSCLISFPFRGWYNNIWSSIRIWSIFDWLFCHLCRSFVSLFDWILVYYRSYMFGPRIVYHLIAFKLLHFHSCYIE